MDILQKETKPEQTLALKVMDGDKRAASRLISLVEDGHPLAVAALEHMQPNVGRCHRLGITGPPGAGKSTLVSVLCGLFREQGQDLVGVVAVDPTSPFSGGAILGDRVRMGGRSGRPDRGVFIRSMASRGAFGGLSPTAADAMDVLDALGCQPVMVETVGVGQSEIEVAGITDTTILVLSPESGDGVQAMKAGVMEVADIFVVNKADRDGARSMARTVEEVMGPKRRAAMDDPDKNWCPPVLMCEARDHKGVEEVVAAIERHRNYLEANQLRLLLAGRRKATERRLRAMVDAELRRRFWTDERQDALTLAVGAVIDDDASPQSALKKLFDPS